MSTIPTLFNAAVKALNTGDYGQLSRLSQQILSLDRTHADAWFFLSIAAAASQQIKKALEFIDQALKLKPDNNAEYLAQKARLHSMLNQYSAAMQAADKAFSLNPGNAQVLDTLGVVYSKLEDHNKACSVLTLAVKKKPDNAQFQFNLASAQQFLGHGEEAKQCYEKAIAIRPNFARAHWALSELEKNQTDPDRLKKLEQLLSKPNVNEADELYLSHALSRTYEQENEYQKAFNILYKAKKRFKRRINYSFDHDQKIFDSLKENFTQANISSSSSHSLGEDAIFVLGMPRSGTTLVERILNAHSQVHSLGELQEFPRALKSISETQSRIVLDKEVIVNASSKNPAQLGELYLQMLKERINPGKKFIDKLPLNFFNIGFIMQALPQAKVIVLKRNPLDTCLSNFRQLFALNFSYYNYDFDLEDTAHYIVQFESLMQHWQTLWGDRILRVSYEELTSEPKQGIQTILNYVDLPWQESCLNFHENKDAVATASTMQVRQAIYRSSVARWKKYAEQLKPAIKIFEAAKLL